MPTNDVELDAKGPAVLCDAREIGALDADGDALAQGRVYVGPARDARVFYYEPEDTVPGLIRVLVDEPAPADLVARASRTRSELSLELPTGELVVCGAAALSKHAAVDASTLDRITVPKGLYALDAYILEMTDEELSEDGPKLDARATLTQSMVIISVVWFAFASLVYGILASEGLARDALSIYAVAGVFPMLLAIIVHRATGGSARARAATREYRETATKIPSLLVVLTPSNEKRVGGGITTDD